MMLVPVILFLAGSLSSAVAGPHARLKSSKNWAKKARFLEVVSSESSPPSSSTAFNPVAAATKPNIFDSLTDDEASLTGDNAIEMMDLVQPNKTGKRHSFFYLDNGCPAPDRFAVARIAFGATEEVIERYTVRRAIDYLFVGQPYVQEFLVGPLPISKKTAYASFDWLPRAGAPKFAITMLVCLIILVVRVPDSQNCAKDEDLLTQWNLDVTATATGSDNDDFDIWGIDPLWREEIDGEERIILWNTYWRYPADDNALFDGKLFRSSHLDRETLLPQGLFFKSDITGRDSSKWKVLGWVYGEIFYPTTEKFREAWNSPDFVKYELNLLGSWIGSDRLYGKVGDFLPGDNIAPPLAIQPSVPPLTPLTSHVSKGHRGAFVRHQVQGRPHYYGWVVRRFSLRKRFGFDAPRTVQEAVTHYAGNDPVQSGTAYLGTLYGFVILLPVHER
ncbi:hypothetical protein B0H14DRAFT_2590189 [Mycena olivaceomarginata]|nr:hypothetical protein B0H14DRAFT_2590189 [Mycena olivaceomarginata]